VQSGTVFLAWESVPGFSQYNIKVLDVQNEQEKVVIETNVNDSTQLKFGVAKPGTYKWSVATVSPEGQLSARSQSRLFKVEELPQLMWANSKESETYLYFSEKPQMKVAVRSFDRAKTYKFLYKKTEASDGEFKKSESNKNEKIIDVDADGLYQVVVEAQNEKGIVVARSSQKDILIQLKPFLVAPEFFGPVSENIQASKNGNAIVKFKNVAGAKSYVLTVKNSSGKIERKEKLTANSATLKKLLPGNYRLSLSSVDEHGRAGSEGKEKTLLVPQTSDSKAPGFKKLKIK
jgi:hypothetical protein